MICKQTLPEEVEQVGRSMGLNVQKPRIVGVNGNVLHQRCCGSGGKSGGIPVSQHRIGHDDRNVVADLRRTGL